MLQLGNLVLNLGLVVPARLHATLRVADRFEHHAGLLQVVREVVFLLRELGHENPDLVRDITNGLVVGLFTPFRQLRGDGGTLPPCLFVGLDGVAFGFDQFVELLGQIGLSMSAQTAP